MSLGVLLLLCNLAAKTQVSSGVFLQMIKKDGIRSSWSSNLGLNGSNEWANQSHRKYMLTQLTFLE